MEARSLKYIAEACAGDLHQADPETLACGICTDSRSAAAGDLFLALNGERFDGHDFLPEVYKKGVVAALVEKGKKRRAPEALPLIVVDQPRMALIQIAARYRSEFVLPLIAIGGSNGKTTTKDLVAAVLRRRWPTLWSEASFNNDIGVPLTLLRLASSHRAAVVEVGTNHPGELAPLIRLARPRYGVITSLGREHLEFFGDLPGVAEEEGWLAELLPADGELFVHGDSPEIARVIRRAPGRVQRVGFGSENEWRIGTVALSEASTTFAVHAPLSAYSGEYRIKILGRHHAVNAVLALAVASALGFPPEELKLGLEECLPPNLRMQTWTVNGVQVLEDCYNANADSMRAALETLAAMQCRGRRVAVLGDMAEQGAQREAMHAEVGRVCGELGVDWLLAVGDMAEVTAGHARRAGVEQVSVHAEAEEAAGILKEILGPGDLVLVKASRTTRLERIGQSLRKENKFAGNPRSV